MRTLTFAFALGLLPVAAGACPDYTLWGDQKIETTAADLYSPKAVSLVAGGDRDLSRCGIRAQNWNGGLVGYVIEQPDISLTVRQLDGYQIEFRTVSNCDTVLLINTAAANWYFDDDDNGNGGAKIRLTRPAGDGIYDIWVGTYGSGNCDAQLIVETF